MDDRPHPSISLLVLPQHLDRFVLAKVAVNDPT